MTAGLSRELSVIVAPLVWATHFVLSYVLLSIGCALDWQAARIFGLDLIRCLLLLLTAAAVVALLVLLGTARRAGRSVRIGSRSRFMATIAGGLSILSLIAVIWIGLAIMLIPPCN